MHARKRSAVLLILSLCALTQASDKTPTSDDKSLELGVDADLTKTPQSDDNSQELGVDGDLTNTPQSDDTSQELGVDADLTKTPQSDDNSQELGVDGDLTKTPQSDDKSQELGVDADLTKTPQSGDNSQELGVDADLTKTPQSDDKSLELGVDADLTETPQSGDNNQELGVDADLTKTPKSDDNSQEIGVNGDLTKQKSILDCLSEAEKAKEDSAAVQSAECEHLSKRIQAFSPEEADKELNTVDGVGRTLLHWACRRRDSELALLILQHPEFELLNTVDTAAAETALMICAKYALRDVSRSIMEKHGPDKMSISLFQQNVNRRTVLHYAAARGAHEIVRLLCKVGDYEFVSHPDINGFTALDYALDCNGTNRATKRAKDVAKLKRVKWDGTIEEGDMWHERMSGNLGCKAENDGNPDNLDHSKTVEILQRVLRRYGQVLGFNSAPGLAAEGSSTQEGPILKCLRGKADKACEDGLEEQIRGLSGTEASKHLNEMDHRGRGPLHWAVARNLPKVALAIVQNAEFTSINDPEASIAEPALFWAVDREMTDVAREIVDSLASSKFALFQQGTFQRTVLHYAAAKGMHQLVELICSKVKVRFLDDFLSHTDINGFTALDYAKDCKGETRSDAKVIRRRLSDEEPSMDRWHYDQYGDIGCKEDLVQNHEKTVQILERYRYNCEPCPGLGESGDSPSETHDEDTPSELPEGDGPSEARDEVSPSESPDASSG